MACPFGSGWIQDMIKGETEKSVNSMDDDYINWFMPKMQEDLKMVM